MKYVDEFRDPELGRALAGEILQLVEPGRHYKLMEVCGGHTHSIYKFGIDDLLPENVELVHGPGCPVCVIPMGRVDDGIALAHQPGVIFTCFGDMMRIPGSDGSLLDAKAEGADIRMVYSPLDALRIAKQNPDRQVVFFAIGFETTAPSTALTLKRAKAEGVQNFSVMCNHVTIVPPLRALLDSPDLRLDGFIGPGHVSTVVGARPFEFIPADYGRPIVVSGFEPLDVLQGVQMILKQLAEGRCEVENQYTRVVPYEGNLRALEVMSEVFELRPHFEWRGLGFICQSGLRLSDAYADFDAEQRWEVPGHPRGRPEGVPVRRGAQGRDQAVRVQGVRHRVHAGAADRHVHGLLRGGLRRLLQLRPLRAGAGGRVTDAVSERETKILGIIETARAKRGKFRDEHITMSHGAGGKATQSLIEGLFAPAFGSDADADAGAVDDGLVMTTDSFVVKPIRFPGGSIGELAVNGTVNDLAVSGARPLALSLSLILEEGLSSQTLREEVEAIASAARDADVQIVAGDTKVVERGHADSHLRHHDRRWTDRPACLGCPRLPFDPETGSWSPAGSATTAPRSCSRAASSSSAAPRSSPTPAACGRRSTRCSRSPGPRLRCMRDATRGGVASVLNELARASNVAMLVREAAVPVHPAVAGAAEILGIDPMYVANEGKFVAFVDPDHADAALAALRGVPGCEDAAEIGEVRTEPPGMVLVETGFGGKRVMDQLVGDPLPRIC